MSDLKDQLAFRSDLLNAMLTTAISGLGIKREDITPEDLQEIKKAIGLYFQKKNGVRGLTDHIPVSGRAEIIMRGPDGQIKQQGIFENLMVTAGKNHSADQMSDGGETAMSHMAIGTGTTSPVVGDTTLETELDRNALTSKTQQNGNEVKYIGDWAAGDGTGAITEAGIFNAAAAGTMLARLVFAVYNKGAGDIIQIQWTITYG